MRRKTCSEEKETLIENRGDKLLEPPYRPLNVFKRKPGKRGKLVNLLVHEGLCQSTSVPVNRQPDL